MSAVLECRGLSHSFGSQPVLHDVSFTITKGEFICLLGPSGVGKTTLLRLVAGLEKLQRGTILINGWEVANPTEQTKPEKRGVGMVFQHPALFPHLSVAENILFGIAGWPVEARSEKLAALLRQIQMETQKNVLPHQLSGGQHQRVALARALAAGPSLLLLDEPFASLDPALRERIRIQTRKIARDQSVSVLMVTHDAQEAMSLADRIVVMDKSGGIAQIGTPAEIYQRPASLEVAQFFTSGNYFSSRVERARIATPLGTIEAGALAEGAQVDVLVRPEDIEPTANGAAAEILDYHCAGHYCSLSLVLPEGNRVTMLVDKDYPHQPGQKLALRVKPGRALVFPAQAS